MIIISLFLSILFQNFAENCQCNIQFSISQVASSICVCGTKNSTFDLDIGGEGRHEKGEIYKTKNNLSVSCKHNKYSFGINTVCEYVGEIPDLLFTNFWNISGDGVSTSSCNKKWKRY